MGTTWSDERNRISMRGSLLVPAPPRARNAQRGETRRAAPRLSTCSTFRLNSAVTPVGVVVGGDQSGPVLDQVGAEQEWSSMGHQQSSCV